MAETEREAALRRIDENARIWNEKKAGKIFTQQEIDSRLRGPVQRPEDIAVTSNDMKPYRARPTVIKDGPVVPADSPSGVTAGSGTAAGATKTTETPKSPDQIKTSKDYIAAKGVDLENDFTNILNDYANVTYHWKLFLADEVGLMAAIQSNPHQYQQIIAAAEKIVIAESGVTAGFNILSVDVEASVAHVRSVRSADAQRFTIQLLEPAGSVLLDKIASSAVTLGIFNINQATYFLELTFLGFDPVAGIPVDLRFRRIWPVQVQSMDATVESSGTTYRIEANVRHDAAFQQEFALSRREETVEGSTVGEVLDRVIRSKNEENEINPLVPNVKYRYEFHGTHKSDKGDPRQWQLWQQPITDPANTMSTKIPSQVARHVQIGAATRFEQLLELLFSLTKQAQQLMGIHRTESRRTTKPVGGTENVGDQGSLNISDPTQLTYGFFRVGAEVTPVSFNRFVNRYDLEITYHIHMYDFYQLVVDYSQVTASQTNEAQKTRWGFLKKRIFKQYHYTFTGLNTDILNFEFRLNGIYQVTMPYLAGLYNYSTIRDGVFLNPNKFDKEKAQREVRHFQETQKQLTNIRQAVNEEVKFNKENEHLGGSLVSTNELLGINLRKQEAEKQEELRRHAGLIRDLPGFTAKTEQFRSTEKVIPLDDIKDPEEKERIGRVNELRSRTIHYAEDASGDIQAVKDWHQMHSLQRGIAWSHDAREAATDTQLHLEDYSQGRTLFGSFMNQLYDMPKDLASVSLEIRGDPWWMGHDPFQMALFRYAPRYEAAIPARGTQPSPGTSIPGLFHAPGDPEPAPLFIETAHMFYLNVGFPIGYDEQTGIPRLGPEAPSFQGVYTVKAVKSSFQNGVFKQTLEATRDPLYRPPSVPAAATRPVGNPGQAREE